MVSWLPLYHDMGLVGFLSIPMTRGVRPRAGRAAGLPGPAGQLDAVDQRLGRHRHRRSELLVGAGDPGARPDERLDLSTLTLALSGAEPVDPAAVEAFVARRRAVRLRCRQRVPGVRHGRGGDRRRRSRPGTAGMVCDSVDRVVLERDRIAKPLDVADADEELDVRRLPLLGKPVPGPRDAGRRPRRRTTSCPSVTSASCCCAARR